MLIFFGQIKKKNKTNSAVLIKQQKVKRKKYAEISQEIEAEVEAEVEAEIVKIL